MSRVIDSKVILAGYVKKERVETNDLHPIQKKIIRQLLIKPQTRKQIIESLIREDNNRGRRGNYPRTTVYDNLKKLEKIGIITYYHKKRRNKLGRPNTFWKISDKFINIK